MKYLVWLTIILLIVPIMFFDVHIIDTTQGVVSREAFGLGQYGFDLNINNSIYFIQVSGPGVFAISEGLEVGSRVEVPTACLNRRASVVPARNINIMRKK